MFKEIKTETYKSQMIQNKLINLLTSNVWHFMDTDKNSFVPFSIEKSFNPDNKEEGYRLWDERNETKEMVAYFDNFEDAKQFIIQVYQYI